MTYPVELILKNLFNLLYADGTIAPQAKTLFQKVAREIGVDSRTLNGFYKEWQAGKDLSPIKGATPEENEIILCFLLYFAGIDGNISESEAGTVREFARLAGYDESGITAFLGQKHPGTVYPTCADMVSSIRKSLHPPASRPASPGSGPSLYVANQMGPEGIDELQSLFLCFKLGLNAALSGPPGVGKTQSVLEIAKVTGQKLFTKVCSARTTESHIISHPVLMERKGVTVTAHENGPLCLAMLEPGIFYGDEYNLLKEDVQKRMNSAFDDRRYIDRNDGIQIRARPGFFPVISYNPSRNMGARDLDDSVADRFVHFHYRDWAADLKAYVSLKRSSRDMNRPSIGHGRFGISLEQRGIDREGRFYLHDGKTGWTDFFTRKNVPNEPEFRYHALKTKNLLSQDSETLKAVENLSNKSYSEVELSRVFSRFLELTSDLATTGHSPMLKKVGLDSLGKKEDLELLAIHKSSIRIQSAALKHYAHLLSRGWNKYLAQSYATSLLIDHMCFGSYRDRKLRDITNHSLLQTIASAFALYADNNVYNTDLIKKAVL